MNARRPYQEEALKAFIKAQLRSFALLWERQAGKSTTFADIALLYMMKKAARTCVYASASLLLGTELGLKQQLRIEESSRLIIERESALIAARMNGLNDPNYRLATADVSTGKEIPDLKADDLADLFEKQRLEFRVYHDRGAYSRTKIIAPNVATARGWSGLVLLDEIAFIKALRELIMAVLPVISTQKDFRIIYSTTPPEYDDTHYSFEMLAPAPDAVFKPNNKGNWYESQSGIAVHRVDAYDSFAAGKKIFDIKTGKELDPNEAFARAPNKSGHRIAHFLAWIAGGAAACDALRLSTAQARGGELGCATWEIESDGDFLRAMSWLADHVDARAKLGLGFDVATTEKGKSNPSVLAVSEESGADTVVRTFLIWKTKDPDVAMERLKTAVRTLSARPGGRPRALAIDATNEKYFAERVRKELRAIIPVILVVANESVNPIEPGKKPRNPKPGIEKMTNWKEYLGGQYVQKLDDNHLALPPETYIYQDHRLVLRDRGRFVCEADEQGRHGDTFDGGKLSLHALSQNIGIVSTAGIKIGFGSNRAQWTPRFSRVKKQLAAA